ncbi:hypothetical protein tb265_02200 [Gemmatimonadetes bacterium T265]|nr:hypothetical protein tb265_02200 [Gemmatimonadetes bacterium T265]
MRPLSAGERRTTGIALGVLVPALLWVRAGQPLLDALAERRAALATERAALARERALVATAPRGVVVRRAVDSLVGATAGRLLAASDDAIAGAELSAYLAGVARTCRVQLTAAETQGASTSRAGVRSVAVVVRGESDTQGIIDFLRALESGGRLLRVDALALSAASSSTSGSDAAPRQAHVVRLRATVVGFGLARAPHAAEPRTAGAALRTPTGAGGAAP